jgi:hypothetical protein
MVIIQQPSGVLTNDQKKIKFEKSSSLREAMSLIVDEGQEIGKLFYKKYFFPTQKTNIGQWNIS